MERETVLSSKIVKENRLEDGIKCFFITNDLERQPSDEAIKGLVMAIKLSSQFDLTLFKCNIDAQNRFKQVCPLLIAAVKKLDTKLNVSDYG